MHGDPVRVEGSRPARPRHPARDRPPRRRPVRRPARPRGRATPRSRCSASAEWAGRGRLPAGARPAGREGEPPLRLLFAGTPAPAVPSPGGAARLAARGRRRPHPARRAAGRGRRPSRSPVAERADAAGIPVLQPRSPREPEFLEQLRRPRRRLRPGRRLRRAGAAGGARPARGTAGSTCTSRCCPPGAAPRPCSTRSWPATRSPAPDVPARGRAGHRPGVRHGHRADRPAATPPATCSAGSPSAAPGCWSPPSTASPTARWSPSRSRPRASASRRGSRPPTRRSTGRCPPHVVDRRVRGVHPRARRLDDVARRAAAARPGACRRPTVDLLAPGELRSARRACSSAPARGAVRLGEVQPAGKRMMPAADWARGARPAAGRAARAHDRGRPGRPPAARDRATAAASGHPPSGARRRPADRLRRAGRRLRAAPPTPTCCCRSCCASGGSTPRDAAFATQLAYGTLRAQGTLDAILTGLVSRPLAELDPRVLDLLRLGRLPADRPAGAGARRGRHHRRPDPRASSAPAPSGLVNAVLRKVAAGGDRAQWLATPRRGRRASGSALATDHPRWIVDAWRDALGGDADELEAALLADDAAPEVHLVARRIDPRRRWSRSPAASPGRGRRTPSGCPAATPGGCPRSAPARPRCRTRAASSPRSRSPGRRSRAPTTAWLDMCAGPGGKAGLLAAVRPAGVRLTAADRAPHRAELVRAGAGRRGRRRGAGRRRHGAAVGRRLLRPGAARRAVHRAGRAAPPAGGALAPDAGRRPAAGRAADRAARRARWPRCGPAGSSPT